MPPVNGAARAVGTQAGTRQQTKCRSMLLPASARERYRGRRLCRPSTAGRPRAGRGGRSDPARLGPPHPLQRARSVPQQRRRSQANAPCLAAHPEQVRSRSQRRQASLPARRLPHPPARIGCRAQRVGRTVAPTTGRKGALWTMPRSISAIPGAEWLARAGQRPRRT